MEQYLNRVECSFDIDQTQCGLAMMAFAYMRSLGILNSEQKEEAVAAIRAFHQREVMQTYDENNPRPERIFKKTADAVHLLNDERFSFAPTAFNEVREQLLIDANLQKHLARIKGAREGTIRLFETFYSDGATPTLPYLTARKKTPEMEAATIRWLNNHKYPYAEQALIGVIPRQKIELMIQTNLMIPTQEGKEPALIQNPKLLALVDDSVADLAQAIVQIHNENKITNNAKAQLLADCLRYVVIVGYGHDEQQTEEHKKTIEHTGAAIFPLYKWSESHVEELINRLGAHAQQRCSLSQNAH